MFEPGVTHRDPPGQEFRQLPRVQLSQAIKGDYFRMPVEFDQREPGISAVCAVKKSQELEQLQLVIKVMFKPEDNFVMLSERKKGGIPLREIFA